MDVHTVISVVVPLDNDSANIHSFLMELSETMDRSYRFFELVLVDNASSDTTRQLVQSMLGAIPRVRYLRMSRPFERDVIISAGLEASIGDYVVTLDPACDPVSSIPELLQAARKCGGIVQGIASNPPRRGILRELVGRMFRRYCRRQLGITLRRGAEDFRAMSRQAVNALLQIKEQHRYLRVLTLTLGYQHETFYYRRKATPPRREKSLSSEAATAIDIVASHSRHPLRVVTIGGMVGALLNLAYAVYVLVIYFAKRNVTEGWTTLSLQQSGMFFFICLILAVLSEYVGTILGEVRSRPLYFIAEDTGSSVLLEDTVATSIVSESNAENND